VAREEKPAHERRIFLRYCGARGLVPGNITQPTPPAPDIIADLPGHGRVAFELVRVNHDDEIISNNLGLESRDFLAEQFAQLPTPQHERLSAMYSDAEVTLKFSPVANPGQRKRVLPFVWTLLETRPAGATGWLFQDADKWLTTCVPGDLETVYVSRLARQTGGPQFSTISTGFPIPVQIDRVIEKLQKRYECAEPLELLAYADGSEFSFEDDLTALGEAVRLHLPGSRFRRVWGFEEIQRKVTLIGELSADE
jgi:hypothetical protein